MLKPTTLMLGEKANKLLKQLSADNGMASKYFFTKIIVREARAEATTLTADKLKARLQLIAEVEDELVDIINNPPKELIADWDYSMNPKSIYMRVWSAHRRLEQRGWSAEDIHAYCIEHYGRDYKIKSTPQKTPKKNPEWVGGGAVAQKTKDANKVSRKIEVK